MKTVEQRSPVQYSSRRQSMWVLDVYNPGQLSISLPVPKPGPDCVQRGGILQRARRKIDCDRWDIASCWSEPTCTWRRRSRQRWTWSCSSRHQWTASSRAAAAAAATTKTTKTAVNTKWFASRSVSASRQTSHRRTIICQYLFTSLNSFASIRNWQKWIFN